ncbi:acyl-CoA dehydrogenase family protein [Nocardioides sp. cx-173]|uniref:acyl-CoA dehydrogenase family protein n=1 Tax=Nocardioides sp. cx-173 TaxID=2898796 RepID=UPI001E54A186|nr:acyl-CoA dehydrogenase family protein [Nocardioides sp. cx-173]MCD4524126.1 acyl-CoA/acyl-ACP dehydrogenase [Nocardioides sp. cx-173]UGB41523.1 acyl-CoA/acyl-ACP dehydrogenase [Nocardioides sp. cx-173]
MRFALTQEQEELAAAVRGLVERRAGTLDLRAAAASERGYDQELWSTLASQIGVAALAVPEEYGGAGFGLFETHVVLEQLGAALTPSPLLGSGVLAAQAVLVAAGPDDCARLVPGLAEGTTIGALAWADPAGRWRTDGSDVTATEDGGWTLTGTATLVLDGARADLLLAVADTGSGMGLFEVDPAAVGVTRTPTPALDLTLQLAEVRFEEAPATALSTDAGAALERLHAIAAVAVTALQVGGAQAALDRTVAHLQEREQFGRPLGSFQALKHRVADLLVAVETARSISWAGAWATSRDTPDLLLKASLAKAWCSEAFSTVAAEAVQLHGGIAITWEHDAQLYLKRAHATAQLFGAAHEHRARILQAL